MRWVEQDIVSHMGRKNNSSHQIRSIYHIISYHITFYYLLDHNLNFFFCYYNNRSLCPSDICFITNWIAKYKRYNKIDHYVSTAFFYEKYIMQLFSKDATISLKKFGPLKTWKKHPQKLLIIGLNFFQYCQPAQNQSKSQFLFHKNCSTCNLSIMTLFRAYLKNILKVLGGGNRGKIPSIEYIQDLNFSKFILGNQISAVCSGATMTTVIKHLLYPFHLLFVISQQKLGTLFCVW